MKSHNSRSGVVLFQKLFLWYQSFILGKLSQFYLSTVSHFRCHINFPSLLSSPHNHEVIIILHDLPIPICPEYKQLCFYYSQTNFLLWKIQIMGLFESRDMAGFLNGELSIPNCRITLSTAEGTSQEADNPDYLAWRRSERLLSGWITGTLSEEVLGMVVGLDTFAEVWATLLNHFTRGSQEREFCLLQLQGRKPTGPRTELACKDKDRAGGTAGRCPHT